MKAINIRDLNNDPSLRKNMGFFKKLSNEKGLTQAQLFEKMVKFCYVNGMFKETNNGKK